MMYMQTQTGYTCIKMTHISGCNNVNQW